MIDDCVIQFRWLTLLLRLLKDGKLSMTKGFTICAISQAWLASPHLLIGWEVFGVCPDAEPFRDCVGSFPWGVGKS